MFCSMAHTNSQLSPPGANMSMFLSPLLNIKIFTCNGLTIAQTTSINRGLLCRKDGLDFSYIREALNGTVNLVGPAAAIYIHIQETTALGLLVQSKNGEKYAC